MEAKAILFPGGGQRFSEGPFRHFLHLSDRLVGSGRLPNSSSAAAAKVAFPSHPFSPPSPAVFFYLSSSESSSWEISSLLLRRQMDRPPPPPISYFRSSSVRPWQPGGKDKGEEDMSSQNATHM